MNVLIGRNNTGKSNLLDLIRLLGLMTAGQRLPPDRELTTRGATHSDVKIVLRLDPEERSEIIRWYAGGQPEIERRLSESKFALTLAHHFELDSGGIVSEQLFTTNVVDGDLQMWEGVSHSPNGWDLGWSNSIGPDLVTSMGTRNLGTTQQRHEGGIPVPPWRVFINAGAADLLPQKVLGFYSGIDWVWPSRQAQTQQAPQETTRLDQSGSNLPQLWGTLLGDETEALLKIGRDLANTVDDVSAIGAPTRGNQVRPFIRERSGQQFDLANTSSGIHQLAILETKIARARPGSVLCIEEPELHLHPGAQRHLRRLIGLQTKTVQFFLTTHSTVFLGVPGESRAILFSKTPTGTSARPLLTQVDLAALKWELGTSNADLFGYDLVVLVEGESEEIFLPTVAEHLGLDLTGRGARLIRLGGKDRIPKLKEFLTYLKDTATDVFVVLDQDPEILGKLEDWEREGLLKKDRYRMWPGNFEDLFPVKDILLACSRIGLENLDAPRVEQLSTEGSIVTALRRTMYESGHSDLDKSELAETLAQLVISNEISPPKPIAELISHLKNITRE